MTDRTDQKRVAVEVHDPELSPRANEIMTGEVRSALGTDEVVLDRERAARAGRGHTRRSALGAVLWGRRMLIGVTLAGAVVVAAILVLSTGSWWWLLLPLGAHVVTTLAMATATMAITDRVESPDPVVTADLEAQGVRQAERVFDEHVRSFTPADGPAVTHADPGAQVPRHALLWPAGAGAFLLPATVAIAALAGGGLMWLLVPVVWPPALGLVAFEVRAYRAMPSGAERATEGSERAPSG